MWFVSEGIRSIYSKKWKKPPPLTLVATCNNSSSPIHPFFFGGGCEKTSRRMVRSVCNHTPYITYLIWMRSYTDYSTSACLFNFLHEKIFNFWRRDTAGSELSAVFRIRIKTMRIRILGSALANSDPNQDPKHWLSGYIR